MRPRTQSLGDTKYCTFNMVTVLVIGCGIVGPAISLLLKKKGFDPVIVEKVKQHGDAGLSLGMFPNGYVNHHQRSCSDHTLASKFCHFSD